MNQVGKFEQLQTVAKLLNTEPKILMDFFVDVGLEVLSRTHLNLLKNFKTRLDDFLETIEPGAGLSFESKIDLSDFSADDLKKIKENILKVFDRVESKKS